MDQCLLRQIQEWGMQANQFIVTVFRQKLVILQHFQTLRSVFLLDREECLERLRFVLFDKMQENRIEWSDSNTLNSLLNASLSSCDVAFSDRFSLRLDLNVPLLKSSRIESMHRLEFMYDAPWPLSVVIDAECIAQYSALCVFLLQIRRVEDSIIAIKLKFRHRNTIPHALWLHLNTMLHFVRNVHEHIKRQCLTTVWDDLENAVHHATTVHDMRQAHHLYLSKMYERCFLLPKVM